MNKEKQEELRGLLAHGMLDEFEYHRVTELLDHVAELEKELANLRAWYEEENAATGPQYDAGYADGKSAGIIEGAKNKKDELLPLFNEREAALIQDLNALRSERDKYRLLLNPSDSMRIKTLSGLLNDPNAAVLIHYCDVGDEVKIDRYYKNTNGTIDITSIEEISSSLGGNIPGTLDGEELDIATLRAAIDKARGK